MPPEKSAITKSNQNLYRIILWAIVILYTASLPYVILVYEKITRHFSPQTVGSIPLVMNILMGVAYVIAGVIKKRLGRCIITLALGGVIVYWIIAFEFNTNKHIHIPEYVLMTWLLYLAMIIDYKGRGILLLVFICAGLLGVVDEISQGIHPLRSYGWRDMIIDVASSLIGILTLVGMTNRLRGDWSWIGQLKQYKVVVAATVMGVPVTVLVCILLFAVQARGNFGVVYPVWLIAGSGLFLSYTAVTLFFFWHQRLRSDKFAQGLNPVNTDYRKTALLWTICPLAIFININLLVLGAVVAGIEFR